ncbi:hypothetical protein BC828DRAFT_379734 [Blastocladiella britannica]|nr:hypothetical protein BC828DRAFT_379734 [Blastocladiella britannica]
MSMSQAKPGAASTPGGARTGSAARARPGSSSRTPTKQPGGKSAAAAPTATPTVTVPEFTSTGTKNPLARMFSSSPGGGLVTSGDGPDPSKLAMAVETVPSEIMAAFIGDSVPLLDTFVTAEFLGDLDAIMDADPSACEPWTVPARHLPVTSASSSHTPSKDEHRSRSTRPVSARTATVAAQRAVVDAELDLAVVTKWAERVKLRCLIPKGGLMVQEMDARERWVVGFHHGNYAYATFYGSFFTWRYLNCGVFVSWCREQNLTREQASVILALGKLLLERVLATISRLDPADPTSPNSLNSGASAENGAGGKSPNPFVKATSGKSSTQLPKRGGKPGTDPFASIGASLPNVPVAHLRPILDAYLGKVVAAHTMPAGAGLGGAPGGGAPTATTAAGGGSSGLKVAGGGTGAGQGGGSTTSNGPVAGAGGTSGGSGGATSATKDAAAKDDGTVDPALAKSQVLTLPLAELTVLHYRSILLDHVRLVRHAYMNPKRIAPHAPSKSISDDPLRSSGPRRREGSARRLGNGQSRYSPQHQYDQAAAATDSDDMGADEMDSCSDWSSSSSSDSEDVQGGGWISSAQRGHPSSSSASLPSWQAKGSTAAALRGPHKIPRKLGGGSSENWSKPIGPRPGSGSGVGRSVTFEDGSRPGSATSAGRPDLGLVLDGMAKDMEDKLRGIVSASRAAQ